MGAQDGKFDVQRRVEHSIRGLLIGEYPFILCLTDVLPLGNGLTCRIGSLVVVADDATKEAVVADGYPVVVVERDAGKGRDVDPVFQRVFDILRQLGVQRMDTFDNQHRITCQLQLFAVPFALARGEVVFRNLHTLAFHQPRQVVLQQGIVHRLDVVEVVVAIGQLGRIHAIDEIVVGRERHRTQATGQQLDGESLAERGLS